jgi:hypothetical protein
MKSLVFITSSLLGASSVEAWEVRKLGQDDRKLGQVDFLVSQASPEKELLCVSAADGMRNFGNLKLKPCDFEQYPPEQLWNYQDGILYNDIGNGNSKCMVANDVLDGVRMRLADCDESLAAYYEFIYDGEFIKFTSNQSYCITNRGPNANDGDPIHARPCSDRADFKWWHTGNDPRGTLYSFYAEGGCIQTNNDST